MQKGPGGCKARKAIREITHSAQLVRQRARAHEVKFPVYTKKVHRLIYSKTVHEVVVMAQKFGFREDELDAVEFWNDKTHPEFKAVADVIGLCAAPHTHFTNAHAFVRI